MNNHQLKKSYKQTAVGIIPEDWEVVSIKQIGNIKTGPFGTLLKANEYSDDSEGTPLISVGEIGEGIFRINKHTPLIPKSVVKRMPEYVLKYGDIVFGRKGAVERSAMIDRHQVGWFLGSDGIRIRLPKSINPIFVTYQFQRNQVQSWLLQNATGTTMASMNQEILGRVIFPLPPLPEQKAIAEVLSDVDALITTLDELIAKKRNIKQGTMSLLLTGKKRLVAEVKKGFKQTEIGHIPEDWEVEELGNLTTLLTNGFVGVATFHYTNSDNGILYIQGFNVEENSFNFTGIKKVTANFHKRNSKSNLREGDLLTIQTGDVGLTTIVPKNLEGSNCHALIISRFKNWRAFPKFYSHYFNSHIGRNRLKDLETGTTMKHLNVGDMKYWKIPFPPIAEQKAIAEILSEMDAEIEALEAKRDKCKALKQGMMQELLTGKTRLITKEG